MHKIQTQCFAVIYIPFFSLQCAQQKRALLGHRLSDQLSLDVIEPDIGRVRQQNICDDVSSDIPAALLDQDGIHVIELNPAAERAGIHPGVSTSQAIARAADLVLYPRTLSTEEHLQNTLLQLVYRYSPFIENSAPGICTLDLKGKRTRRHQLWLRELLTKLRSVGLNAQAGIGPNPEIALQAAKIADPILEISQDN